MRSRPGAARTILLFHTICVRPPNQPQIMENVEEEEEEEEEGEEEEEEEAD